MHANILFKNIIYQRCTPNDLIGFVSAFCLTHMYIYYVFTVVYNYFCCFVRRCIGDERCDWKWYPVERTYSWQSDQGESHTWELLQQSDRPAYRTETKVQYTQYIIVLYNLYYNSRLCFLSFIYFIWYYKLYIFLIFISTFTKHIYI